LRFGVQLQAQRTTWHAFATALATVEQLGFDTVWTFDHLLPFSGPDDGAAFETLTTLGAMAALTSRIRVGALVNGVMYRDPATLAKGAALVDQISDGRLEFSLGAAWAEREFHAYGLPYPALQERYDRLDEALQIVKSLWTQPRTTFRGRYYEVNDAPFAPKPVQQPHPPIMIGGSGRGSLRMAAKHATSWNGQGTPEKAAARAALLETLCGEAGRDFADIELSWHGQTAIAATHDEAETEAARAMAEHGQAYNPDGWMIGTPDEVIEQFRAYAAVGFSHWIVGVGHPFDTGSLRLLAEQVIPALR
jgi:alkanesulfonate monooxygenase SsuD/methylene tetrahydromethanopterin reductase-like flavin-dependent oxidoreductase (luciferase family)